jgi:hypothetical protein
MPLAAADQTSKPVKPAVTFTDREERPVSRSARWAPTSQAGLDSYDAGQKRDDAGL